MSEAAAQLLVEALIASALALVSVTPDTVTLDVPVSFIVTVRLSPFSRLMPLKPESPASLSIWVRIESNWVARLARTVVSEVC